MATVSERIAKMGEELDRIDSELYSLLTPRQVEEWDSIEHLADVNGARWQAVSLVEKAIAMLQKAEQEAKAGGQ
jgi:hypothetical protein